MVQPVKGNQSSNTGNSVSMDDAVVEDEFEDSQNVEEIRNKNPFLLTSAVSSSKCFFSLR